MSFAMIHIVSPAIFHDFATFIGHMFVNNEYRAGGLKWFEWTDTYHWSAVNDEYHSKHAECVCRGHILSFERLIRQIAIEYVLVTFGV